MWAVEIEERSNIRIIWRCIWWRGVEYLLNMNVDWFKPFVRGTAYSTGAIYLRIFLAISAREFDTYWLDTRSIWTVIFERIPHTSDRGITWAMERSCHICKIKFISPARVKAALSCCACDVPASRKVCGFLSHNATCRCNKASKFSLSLTEWRNSQTTLDLIKKNWLLRTNDDHRSKVVKLQKEHLSALLCYSLCHTLIWFISQSLIRWTICSLEVVNMPSKCGLIET